MLRAVVHVDMVGADGCRGDKPDARATKQRLIATGTSADNECIDTLEHLGRNIDSTLVAHLGIGLQHTPNKWDILIDDYTHNLRLHSFYVVNFYKDTQFSKNYTIFA